MYYSGTLILLSTVFLSSRDCLLLSHGRRPYLRGVTLGTIDVRHLRFLRFELCVTILADVLEGSLLTADQVLNGLEDSHVQQ